MNEILKTIATRYSCRDFADTPLTDEQIKAIAEAALASPSAMNRQPWQIIIITDKALIEELDAEGMRIIASWKDKSTYERINSRGGKLFYNAPCMVVVASEGSSSDCGIVQIFKCLFRPYASNGSNLDCGIVSQNISLAAHSLGLGSVICGMAGFPLSGPRADELKKRLKFPDGYKFGIAVLVGTAKSGKTPHKLDMSKLTYI